MGSNPGFLLGGRHPLPPRADIGPGGQSVGRAPFCLDMIADEAGVKQRPFRLLFLAPLFTIRLFNSRATASRTKSVRSSPSSSTGHDNGPPEQLFGAHSQGPRLSFVLDVRRFTRPPALCSTVAALIWAVGNGSAAPNPVDKSALAPSRMGVAMALELSISYGAQPPESRNRVRTDL
jgi:hypothetical protein